MNLVSRIFIEPFRRYRSINFYFSFRHSARAPPAWSPRSDNWTPLSTARAHGHMFHSSSVQKLTLFFVVDMGKLKGVKYSRIMEKRKEKNHHHGKGIHSGIITHFYPSINPSIHHYSLPSNINYGSSINSIIHQSIHPSIIIPYHLISITGHPTTTILEFSSSSSPCILGIIQPSIQSLIHSLL